MRSPFSSGTHHKVRRQTMAQCELDHLLEAFAADALTPQERKQLQAAARRDQRLLSALADAQALKEVLSDPVLRAKLLSELEAGSGARRIWKRWRRHPGMRIAMAGAIIASVAILVGTQFYPNLISEQQAAVDREDTVPLPALPAPSRKPEADPAGERQSKVELTQANSPPISKTLSPALPESDLAGMVPNEDAISSVASNKPENHRPVTQRTASRLAAPVTEGHLGDAIQAPLAGLRKPEPARLVTKKTDSPARSMIESPAEPEPDSKGTMLDDEVMPPPSHKSASPTRQQAVLLVSADPEENTLQHISNPRTLFYGEPEQVASAAILHSVESDQAADWKHEPFLPSPRPAPLAVRYSLVVSGPDGKDREIDPETPVGVSDRPRLAVQTNQDGYLAATEVPSIAKIAYTPAVAAQPVKAGTTMVYSLADLITNRAASPVFRLRLAFGRRPPDAKDLLLQTSAHRLEERIEPAPGGRGEHAVYAATLDDSASPMLILDLALNQRVSPKHNRTIH